MDMNVLDTNRQAMNLLAVSSTVVAAAGFSVLWALVKGQGFGWHYFAGNLSAPWLLLPLVGVACLGAGSRSLKSLSAGVIALVSLVAFYATTAMIWHAVNVHTVRNNAFFVIAGTGFCTVLGFVVARVVRSVRAAFLVTGFFLFFEPLVALAYGSSIGVVTGTSMTVGFVESVVGLVLMIASRPRRAGTLS